MEKFICILRNGLYNNNTYNNNMLSTHIKVWQFVMCLNFCKRRRLSFTRQTYQENQSQHSQPPWEKQIPSEPIMPSSKNTHQIGTWSTEKRGWHHKPVLVCPWRQCDQDISQLEMLDRYIIIVLTLPFEVGRCLLWLVEDVLQIVFGSVGMARGNHQFSLWGKMSK